MVSQVEIHFLQENAEARAPPQPLAPGSCLCSGAGDGCHAAGGGCGSAGVGGRGAAGSCQNCPVSWVDVPCDLPMKMVFVMFALDVSLPDMHDDG